MSVFDVLREKLGEQKQRTRELRGKPHMDYGTLCGLEAGIDNAIEIVNQVEQQYNDGWIPVSERYPENETEVEITFVRKHYMTKETLYLTARAFYTDGTLTTEDSAYWWNETDNWEYNEEKDAYKIPEGWWESVSFAEEFCAVDAEVIAWKPLPEPYRGSDN